MSWSTPERLKCEMKAKVEGSGRLVKEYDETWKIISSTASNPDAAAAALGVLPGAPYSDWPGATCDLIHPVRQMSREPYETYHIHTHYSTVAVVPEDTASTAPELRRVKRRVGHVEQQHFITKDSSAVAILDAAGSPYDGGVPVTDKFPVYFWERDETHASLASVAALCTLTGSLNGDVFMGHAIGTLQIEITAEEEHQGAYHFWKVVYTAVNNPDGWQPSPLNAGLWQKVAGLRKRILEDDGKPCQEPQPLTTLGAVVPTASRPASCNFLTVTHFPSITYSALGLPTT